MNITDVGHLTGVEGIGSSWSGYLFKKLYDRTTDWNAE
jgi:hypothetical protein